MKRTKTVPIKRRKKTPIKRTSRKKSGTKSKCTKEVIEQVEGLCKLGLTNAQLAEYFNVTPNAIANWAKNNRAFRTAMNRGRTEGDIPVVKSLYQLALGFEKKAVKLFKNRVVEKFYDDDGKVVQEISRDEIIEHEYMEYYPPNVKAAIKILNARHRNQWAEQHNVQHQHMHFHSEIDSEQVLSQISDKNEISDEELKLIAKWGLSDKTEVGQEENNA